MLLRFETICGFNIGAEYVTHAELGEDFGGWIFLIDLGILRIIIEKLPS